MSSASQPRLQVVVRPVDQSDVPLCATSDAHLADRAATWCGGAAVDLDHPALATLAPGLTVRHGPGTLECGVVRGDELVPVPIVRTQAEVDALCEGIFCAQILIDAHGTTYLPDVRQYHDHTGSDLPAGHTDYLDPPGQRPHGLITVYDHDAGTAKARALTAAAAVSLTIQSGTPLHQALLAAPIQPAR